MAEIEQLHPETNKIDAEIVSFFSGAGFLDLGFEKAGFQISYMNEIYKPFIEAYQHARQKMNLAEPAHGYHEGSIDSFLSGSDKETLSHIVSKAQKNGKLVGFIGGPPCPDFSVGGKNKGRAGDNGRLSGSYIDIICQQKPDFFLFENVKGLWRTKKHRAFYDELKKKLEKEGYLLTDKLINAISYGAPQDRDRIILLGFRKETFSSALDTKSFNWNQHANFPDRTAFDIEWPQTNAFKKNSVTKIPIDIPEELTVHHWFEKNDVYNHPNSEHSFTPRAGLAKFRVIPEGDDKKKSYKRLHRWRYSPTACYGNNEVHLHPYLERRISAAEALALQSLPKEFELPESMSLTNMFKTIGNGVPFLAAHALAKTIKDFISEANNEENNYSVQHSKRYR